MVVDKNDIVVINDIECIKVTNVGKYLGATPETCRRKIPNDKINAKAIRLGKAWCISLTNLYTLKKLQDKFWDEHIDYKKACNLYSVAFLKDKTRIDIPYYAKTCKSDWAYIKSELTNAVDLKELDYINYISRKEAKIMLRLNDTDLKNTIINYGIEVKKRGANYMPLKEDVEFFMIQQQEIGSRYISYKEATETYGNYITEHITSYPIPPFVRLIDYFEKGSLRYYDRNEIQEYIKNRDLRESFHSLNEDTDFETFKNKLSLIETFNNFSNMPYTGEKWFNYISNHLNNISCNPKSTQLRINSLIRSTIELEKYLILNGNVEVYTLSTAQLNLLLKGINTPIEAFQIYKFIKLVAQDIELKLKSVNNANKSFSFDKLIHPLKEERKKTDKDLKKEVYDFMTYKKLFDFLNDVKYHKSFIFNNHLTTREKGIYLSSWLYLLLHLNNAWRNADIADFPRLYLDDIEQHYGIDDFNWFENNEISLPLSRQIISRIIKYEFGISKTKVEGHFFCSDKLAPTLSTILIMLDMYIKYTYIGDKKEFNSPVMKFFTKYNQPFEHTLNNFLKPAQIENFKFRSKTMNKSILTYIYNLGDDKDALLLPKYMRSHIKSDSTLHYLALNKEDIEFLSEQLFMRGEFGYIYDTLLQLVGEEQLSLETKTQDISSIKNSFGDELKIEATIGLINYFDDERKEILNLLETEGLENCLKILEDIYLTNLPSREDNIQCLYSQEGCKNPESESCMGCMYSIPSIYALNTLCSDLKNDLVDYIASNSVIKKLKLSSQLYRKKEQLKSAIKRYGTDYIYNLLDITRDEFIDTFSNVLEPKELLILLKER